MFYLPVRIYDESDCVKKHAKELCALGQRALIVTGKSSAKKNGSLDEVISVLKEYGKEYALFSEVEENPGVETVIRGREFGLEEKVDFVIGIGGGSPLDAAKGIALMIAHPTWQEEQLYGETDGEALPVAAIPTTCGTGSEVTGVSVLTRHSLHTKMSFPARVFPKLALIDGKYLKQAPREMLVNTSIDALAHLMESGLSAKASCYSHMAVSEGLSVWQETKEALTGAKQAEPEDHENMMRASTLAGIAIAQTGTSLPHALSYILTYDCGIAHGRAVGYFLPAFLDHAPHSMKEGLLSQAGFTDLSEFSGFLDRLFEPLSVSESVLERAFSVVASNPSKMKSAVYSLSPEILREIVFSEIKYS